MAWWLRQWDAARSSLWFTPLIGLCIASVLAFLSLEVDERFQVTSATGFEWLRTTASAGRLTMSSLAGAMITVTGVVFSMTMVTFGQTSSQFGSRLLRSFLSHSISQVTLALFLGTSLYCFTVLRTIRDFGDGEALVPHLSIFIGLCLGLVCLFSLIYFVHRVAHSIQAESVLRDLSIELDSAIDRLFPEKIGSPPQGREQTIKSDESENETLAAQSTGFVQGIDGSDMLHIAERMEGVIRVLAAPGDFVFAGQHVVEIIDGKLTNEVAAELTQCILIGSRRTPRQDAGCVIREMVEVAVRALSPGINDPYTAVTSIHYLTAALCKLAQREFPKAQRFGSDDELRLVFPVIEFSDLLDQCYREVRSYGSDVFLVRSSLTDSLQQLLLQVKYEEDASSVRKLLDELRNYKADG